MARINRPAPDTTPRTHEGGVAKRITPEAELRRTAMACLLWEDSFYESGEAVADRIKALVPRCKPPFVAELAIEARTKMNLRHVPLLLCRELARGGTLTAHTLSEVIQRPDELTEFLAILWHEGKCAIPAQAKKGLALAFTKFSAYALAKYNRDDAIKLRDVLFLCHAKPKDEAQAAVWKALIDGTLPAPDTWEVALSSGADKRETWERLLTEGKLGALALLRNLRNMGSAGVDPALVKAALASVDVSRVLPFRFIAAARFAPALEPALEAALFRNLSEMPRLKGHTALLIDSSGSMSAQLSAKSDMTRMDAAVGLAMILRELCDDVRVYRFDTTVVEAPPRRGFALRNALGYPSGGTELGSAITRLNNGPAYDRLIVVSDEQAADYVPAPRANANAYMLNVANYQNGVGYGPHWTHIDGFSEACVRYITELEAAR